MKKWLALCANYGWQGRYIEKGDVVESDAKPNEYFAPVANPEEEVAPEKPTKKK